MIKSEVKIEPTALTIFGATGDLSANYLLPALCDLDMDGLLGDDFRLICVGRREFTSETFLDFIIEKSKSLQVLKQAPARKHFLKHLNYYQADFENPESFKGLASTLADEKDGKHICQNRLYYFATSPEYFEPLANILKQYSLLEGCGEHNRKVRVLVEKPFGFDLPSAQKLNGLLQKYFEEEQIYRIDHYVGKETVQNIMVVRFANTLFEPLWNHHYISQIDIEAFYTDHVGKRAKFYDQVGALRDVVQNHILQMLALIAMDEPKELTSEHIRTEKARVLSALFPFTTAQARTDILRGQYEGFEKEVGHPTKTETFMAVQTFINTPRWHGVPFHIRTGMALDNKLTQITIHFKEPPRCLFEGCESNRLTFRIQPDESVFLQINNKIPGFGVKLHQANLEFSYKASFSGELPTAYQRLLLDFIQGDQRLFIRSDEIEAAWKFIDSVRASWNNAPLYRYKPGSNGPISSDPRIE